METLSNIVDTIQEKLGKEESAKISDSLANILVIEEANGKLIKEKDEINKKIQKDKEMLIEANGNLLLHQAQAKEEESFFNPNVSSWNSILIESFLKFIQQRYGINATLIESLEDINCLEFVEFSDFGIMNFDEDRERWSYAVEYNRIVINGGKPYVDGYY